MMEAGKDYGVRVILAYGTYSVGQVLFPPGVLRSHLLDRGLVEVIKAAPDSRRKAVREQ